MLDLLIVMVKAWHGVRWLLLAAVKALASLLDTLCPLCRSTGR